MDLEEYKKQIEGYENFTLNVRNSKGEIVDKIKNNTNGITPETATTIYRTTDKDGKPTYTRKPLDADVSVSLDQNTGNIKIKAPKELTEYDEFKSLVNTDELKNLSQMYKLNPTSKVSINQYNSETNETEQKAVTVPEYIETLNSALENIRENKKNINDYRKNLVGKYGENINKLSDKQLRVNNGSGSSIYIPQAILDMDKDLRNTVDENSMISVKELKKLWTRDKIGREELRTMYATLNNQIKSNQEWGDTYKTSKDGEYYNRNSAEEMARNLGFLNFMQQNDPEASWNQQVGDFIETAGQNFLYWLGRMPAETANLGEMVLTLGQGQTFQNAIKDMDSAFEYYNEVNTLLNDSLAVAQVLGMISGSIAGSVALNWVGGKAAPYAKKGLLKVADKADDLKAVASLKMGQLANKLDVADELLEAGATTAGTLKATDTAIDAAKLTGKSIEAAKTIYNMADDIAKGARTLVNVITPSQKASIAAGLADVMTKGKAFFESGSLASVTTKYVLDTIHDALIYSSSDFRNLIDAVSQDPSVENRQEVIDFWKNEAINNLIFWGVAEGAKTSLKYAGKTPLGQKLNIKATTAINKLEAWTGDKIKDPIKDKFAGGSYIKKLEEKIEKASEKGVSKKLERLQNKLALELQTKDVRSARRDLGNLDVEFDGLKVNKEDYAKFVSLKTRVEALENSIDRYVGEVKNKMNETYNLQTDPATGTKFYINPTLAMADMASSDVHTNLLRMSKQAGMELPKLDMGDFGLPQEVVDYYVGSYKLKLAEAFASRGGTLKDKAENAIAILEGNIEGYSKTVPENIRNYIDEALENKTVQKFYAELNLYGASDARGVLDKGVVAGYMEEGSVFAEVGYMPIVVKQDGVKWIADTDTYKLNLTDDIKELTFNVKPNEHYEDFELVRQVRKRKMAEAEIQKMNLDAYRGDGNQSAKFEVQVSGEETAYVRDVTKNKKSLEQSIDTNMNTMWENAGANVIVGEATRPAITKGLTSGQSNAVANGLPMNQVDDLIEKFELEEIADANKVAMTFLRDETLDFDEWYKKQPASVRNFVNSLAGNTKSQNVSLDEFAMLASDGGDEFLNGYKRAVLAGTPDFKKSDYALEAKRNMDAGQDALYDMSTKADAKRSLKSIEAIDTDRFVDDTCEDFRVLVNDMADGVAKNKGAVKTIATIAEQTDGAEEITKYYALSQLQKKSNQKLIEQKIGERVDKWLSSYGKDLTIDEVKRLKKVANEMFQEVVQNEIDNMSATVKAFAGKYVDGKSIYDKVKELDEKIRGIKEDVGNDVVEYIDDQGRRAFAQVDPAFASIYNYRYKMTRVEASNWAKANAMLSKVFRYNTTGLNVRSWGSQMAYDFGSSIFVAGSFDTIKKNADELKDVFGENIVEQIKNFDPSGYEAKQIAAIAEQTGQSIKEAAVARELAKGTASVTEQTEYAMYKNLRRELSADDLLDNAQNKVKEIAEKYSPDRLINGKRETYLRKRNYVNAYNDAIKNGYTVKQAREHAEFVMRNATTNFNRQLMHLQCIGDSTPYFKAAINGSKSFWRMFSMDPVGISGRIFGGLIIPTMYLTGYSLADEENRKAYMKLPEYQKAGNIIFMMNGQAISIPMPQEIGALVDPFRQFVEYLYNSNENDFWELMMNDMLGLVPYDLQGFSTIDMNVMNGNPTILDRINRGFAREFSSMAPIPIKSMYMLATQTDPYTGKKLTSPDYRYFNEETGEWEGGDNYQSNFARTFAKVFGDEVNPGFAEKLLSGIIGKTGIDLMSSVLSFAVEGVDKGIEATMTNLGSQISAPFTMAVYDKKDTDWKQAIRQLEAEKDNLLHNNTKLQKLNNQLEQETDPEKRQTILAERSNMLNDFYDHVNTAITQLKEAYGGTIDRTKFAALVSLLNFNSDAGWQTGSQYSSNLTQDSYWAGRSEAISVLKGMGVTGTEDASIFGYMTVDKGGNPVVKYTKPTAIMEMENVLRSQDDIHLANIKAAISGADLWNKKQAYRNQVDAIYAKDKLSNSDYEKIDNIWINWNAEVMKTLAPYVSEMSPETAINNSQVMDYLDSLIEVPGAFKVDSRGKHVTNTKLGEGSVKDAYIKNYIRKIFQVNNTGYTGGKNYSDR